MANSKATTGSRTRNWATIVYPESAPENWVAVLDEQHIPAFISPLHDKDNNANGEPKKPHYHVMVMFEGPKTREQAEAVFKLIAGVGCEVVQSMRGMARYLCHLDNQGDKHVYEIADVKCLSGADYLEVIGLPTDVEKGISEMMDFVDTYDVKSFAALCRYAKAYRRDWFKLLVHNCSYIMDKYIKSVAWEALQDEDNIAFPETTE